MKIVIIISRKSTRNFEFTNYNLKSRFTAHPPSAWKKTALRTKSSSRITILGVITERKNPQFLSWLKEDRRQELCWIQIYEESARVNYLIMK
ncbi:Protein broad-minded [Dirofilaria immitis]